MVYSYIFGALKLDGLKLNPAKQRFNPDDPKYYPLYEKCIAYNKPIIFHAGLSWEPGAVTEYAHPFRFERIATLFVFTAAPSYQAVCKD